MCPTVKALPNNSQFTTEFHQGNHIGLPPSFLVTKMFSEARDYILHLRGMWDFITEFLPFFSGLELGRQRSYDAWMIGAIISRSKIYKFLTTFVGSNVTVYNANCVGAV